MKISVMEITPDLATEFLKRNTGNRAIRKRAVDQYADDLRRGNWKLTHQGVAVSPDGRLLDGQHRLSAIVQSGVAAQMVVALDVPESAYLVIDRGKPRLLADALHEDRRIVDPCAYICRLHNNFGSVEPHQAKDVLLNVGPAISEVVAACGHTAKGQTAAAIKAAVALLLMEWHRGPYKEHILDQWRAFVLSDFDAMSPAIKGIHSQDLHRDQCYQSVLSSNCGRPTKKWRSCKPK